MGGGSVARLRSVDRRAGSSGQSLAVRGFRSASRAHHISFEDGVLLLAHIVAVRKPGAPVPVFCGRRGGSSLGARGHPELGHRLPMGHDTEESEEAQEAGSQRHRSGAGMRRIGLQLSLAPRFSRLRRSAPHLRRLRSRSLCDARLKDLRRRQRCASAHGGARG